MIRVENLTKNYGPVKAVKSISFDLNDGQVVGFLGANGAGKSTTLKILTGYIAPTAGDVLIDGLDINEQSIAVRKLIGYLPESNPLYLDMSVFELLKFIANIRGITGNDFKNSSDKATALLLGQRLLANYNPLTMVPLGPIQ